MKKQRWRVGQIGKNHTPQQAAKCLLEISDRIGGIQACVDEFGVVYGVWPASRLAEKVLREAPQYVVGVFHCNRHKLTRTIPAQEIADLAHELTYNIATLRGTA